MNALLLACLNRIICTAIEQSSVVSKSMIVWSYSWTVILFVYNALLSSKSNWLYKTSNYCRILLTYYVHISYTDITSWDNDRAAFSIFYAVFEEWLWISKTGSCKGKITTLDTETLLYKSLRACLYGANHPIFQPVSWEVRSHPPIESVVIFVLRLYGKQDSTVRWDTTAREVGSHWVGWNCSI